MSAANSQPSQQLLQCPHTDGLRGWRIKKILLVIREYCHDAARFATHSGAVSPREFATLRALVAMDAHRIEKGLAVAEPKPWFGKDALERLLANTAMYAGAGGDENICRASLDALAEYLDRNKANGVGEPGWIPEVRSAVARLAHKVDASGLLGGTTTMSREAMHKAGKLDSLDFFFTRRSVRNFTAVMVARAEIEAAVAAAQRTPSVCNRQSWSVYVFPRGDTADTVLACQNGNIGFGHTASHVLLITVDLRTFVYPGERNQGWIDGGMFAMSLIYAFHAQGIGTCPLNWSVDSKADRQLRAVAEIPQHEIVIMMVAIGRLPEYLEVASSWRRPTAEIIRPGRLRRLTDKDRQASR